MIDLSEVKTTRASKAYFPPRRVMEKYRPTWGEAYERVKSQFFSPLLFGIVCGAFTPVSETPYRWAGGVLLVVLFVGWLVWERREQERVNGWEYD